MRIGLYEYRTLLRYFRISYDKTVLLSFRLEQITRIELVTSAWEANVLPLNYVCIGATNQTWTDTIFLSAEFESAVSANFTIVAF